MKETLSFTIQNNLPYIVPISILGNNANANDNTNSNTRYRWDFSSYSPTNENFIRIQYRSVNEVSFRTATVPLVDSSINSVLAAINSLNIGTFYLVQSGASTFIENYNSNYVFGNFDVYNPSSLEVGVFFLNSNGNINVIVNGTTVVSANDSFDSTGSPILVSFGDNITISGNWEALGILNAQWDFATNDPAYGGGSSDSIFSPTALTPFSVSFTINGAYSYGFILDYFV